MPSDGLLSSLYPHLEHSVQIAAYAAHVPLAWLSLYGLEPSPWILSVGERQEKLRRLDQTLSRIWEPHFSQGAPWVVADLNRNEIRPLLSSRTPLSSIRFLWGQAIFNEKDVELGRLYVADYVPRTFDSDQTVCLQKIGTQIAWMLDQILGNTGKTPAAVGTSSELLRRTNRQLQAQIDYLQEQHFYLNQLNNFMDELQEYTTLEEAIAHFPNLLQTLFPKQQGRLYLNTESLAPNLNKRSTIQVLTWGTRTVIWRESLPVDCPLVQMLQEQTASLSTKIQPFLANCNLCQLSPPNAREVHCAPLLTQSVRDGGKWHGVLSLVANLPLSNGPTQRQLVVQAAQHLGKTLTRLKAYDAIHLQSIRDPLTGLFNRRYLFEVMPKLLQRARHGGGSIGLVVCDIDHFKQFNDRYGHLAGDKVLMDFGIFLKGFVRSTDIACRFGGEEFLLVLPDLSLERVVQRAERLRQGMHYLQMEYEGQSLGQVTISAGVAMFPLHGATIEKLIGSADAALYQAKAAGRDRVRIAPVSTN
jgi:diguanylate cyclase (GGDEF)-like protein